MAMSRRTGVVRMVPASHRVGRPTHDAHRARSVIPRISGRSRRYVGRRAAGHLGHLPGAGSPSIRGSHCSVERPTGTRGEHPSFVDPQSPSYGPLPLLLLLVQSKQLDQFGRQADHPLACLSTWYRRCPSGSAAAAGICPPCGHLCHHTVRIFRPKPSHAN